MIELNRRKDNKWIMQKNISSDEILIEFVSLLSNKKVDIDYKELIDGLTKKELYKGRSDTPSTNTMGVRFSEICFYMFGYRPTQNTFIPSPMAENILSKKDKMQPEENFLINLFSLQYPHPYSLTGNNFKIYAGRLFVKLLLEKRINQRLYIDEIVWFLPFIETIDESSYEELISSIKKYRTLPFKEKKAMFKDVKNCEDVFSNVMHEFNYYFLRLFRGFGVINIISDPRHNDGKLFKFKHGRGNTIRNDAYDSRKRNSGYVVLNSDLLPQAEKLTRKFSPFDEPTTMSTKGIYSRRDWLIALYETEPLTYISTISKATEEDKKIFDTINDMVSAARYGSRDGKDFENTLKPFMYLFREVRNVENIGGSGDTDLLCAIEGDGDIYKINVEAKTRKDALSEINSRRLKTHLEKNDSKYCIVVAPRFVSGVTDDISGCNIVTVRADDFGTYCYRECKNNLDGLADFESIHRIIEESYGTDITERIRDLTEKRYGISLSAF